MDTTSERIIESGDMSGNITSTVVHLHNLLHLALSASWNAGATGTLYFEVSADIGAASNWEEVASVAIAGSAGTQLWLDRNAPYTWVRLRYAFTGGTGTLNASFVAKGDK